MATITTKKQLVEKLKDIRSVEVDTRHHYEEDISTFKNFEILDTIKKIKKDEDKHINILDELIKLLEG